MACRCWPSTGWAGRPRPSPPTARCGPPSATSWASTPPRPAHPPPADPPTGPDALPGARGAPPTRGTHPAGRPGRRAGPHPRAPAGGAAGDADRRRWRREDAARAAVSPPTCSPSTPTAYASSSWARCTTPPRWARTSRPRSGAPRTRCTDSACSPSSTTANTSLRRPRPPSTGCCGPRRHHGAGYEPGPAGARRRGPPARAAALAAAARHRRPGAAHRVRCGDSVLPTRPRHPAGVRAHGRQRRCRRRDLPPPGRPPTRPGARRVPDAGTEQHPARRPARGPLPAATAGDPAAPARQQTLRATIEWSYRLLTPAEQAALCALTVFPAGFDLDAAEAVVGPNALFALVDKSVVATRQRTGQMRYELLESIRSFALEQAQPNEIQAARRCHLEHFAGIVERERRAQTNWDSVAWCHGDGRRTRSPGRDRYGARCRRRRRRSAGRLRLLGALPLGWASRAAGLARRGARRRSPPARGSRGAQRRPRRARRVHQLVGAGDAGAVRRPVRRGAPGRRPLRRRPLPGPRPVLRRRVPQPARRPRRGARRVPRRHPVGG